MPPIVLLMASVFLGIKSGINFRFASSVLLREKEKSITLIVIESLSQCLSFWGIPRRKEQLRVGAGLIVVGEAILLCGIYIFAVTLWSLCYTLLLEQMILWVCKLNGFAFTTDWLTVCIWTSVNGFCIMLLMVAKVVAEIKVERDAMKVSLQRIIQIVNKFPPDVKRDQLEVEFETMFQSIEAELRSSTLDPNRMTINGSS